MLIHTGTVILNAKPRIALLIEPCVNVDPALIQCKAVIHLRTIQHGINRILQQFPYKHTGIAVEILACKQLHNALLIHCQPEVSPGISMGRNLGRNLKWEPEISPMFFLALFLNSGAVIQFLSAQLQIRNDPFIHIRICAVRIEFQTITGCIQRKAACLVFLKLLAAFRFLRCSRFIQSHIPKPDLRCAYLINVQQICQTQQDRTHIKISIRIKRSRIKFQILAVTLTEIRNQLQCNVVFR